MIAIECNDIYFLNSSMIKIYNVGRVLWEKAKEDPCQVNCQSACERGCQGCQTRCEKISQCGVCQRSHQCGTCQACQTLCEKSTQCGTREACAGQTPCGKCEKGQSA